MVPEISCLSSTLEKGLMPAFTILLKAARPGNCDDFDEINFLGERVGEMLGSIALIAIGHNSLYALQMLLNLGVDIYTHVRLF